MLLKKCDMTCKSLEECFCSVAFRCVRDGRVLDIGEMVLVWVEKARGFGLPEDVEEIFLANLERSKKEEEERAKKEKEELEVSSETFNPRIVLS